MIEPTDEMRAAFLADQVQKLCPEEIIPSLRCTLADGHGGEHLAWTSPGASMRWTP